MPGRTPAAVAQAAVGQAAKQTLLERLQAKQPRRTWHDLVLDEQALIAVDKAEGELREHELYQRAERIPLAEAALVDARAAAEHAVERLHFLAVPREGYEWLLGACEPTDEQSKRGMTYDIDALLPLLIAASIVDGPKAGAPLTLDQVKAGFDSGAFHDRPLTVDALNELIGEWTQGEVGNVWAKARDLATQAPRASLGNG